MTPEDAVLKLSSVIGWSAGRCGEVVSSETRDALDRLVEVLCTTGCLQDASSVDAGIDAGLTLGLARAASTAPRSSDELPWPPMEPIPACDPMPVFDSDLMPGCLGGWVEDSADQACLPMEMVAVPAMVALASLVGRSVVVRPDVGSSWTTPPNLWGAVVGDPGVMKSHAISAGLHPVKLLAAEAADRHEADSARTNSRILAAECRLGGLKRRKDASKSELEDALRELEEAKTISSERRYITSDPTVEKLAELFKSNPRGLLLSRDELGAWICAMQKPGREGDREFYLESWNGDSSFTVDRIGRGTIRVKSLCLSVIGSLQPTRLREIAETTSRAGGDDGFLQRLQLLVWPDRLPVYERRSSPPDLRAQDAAIEVYRTIDEVCRERWGSPVCFDRRAQPRYDAWRMELETRLRGTELRETPALCSHLAKYRGLVPSLALLSWLVTRDATSPGISLSDVERAISWASYLEQHARRVYSGGEVSRYVPASSRILARLIKNGAVEDGQLARDLYRAGYAGLGTPALVGEALAGLTDLGWLRVESRKGGPGRPAKTIRLHPSISRQIRH